MAEIVDVPEIAENTVINEVKDYMEQQGFRFRTLDGVDINVPKPEEVKGKHEDSDVRDMVDILNRFEHLPLIEYPQSVNTEDAGGVDTPIDAVDQQMRTHFAGMGHAYSSTFEDVITQNRYRVNPMQNVESVWAILPMLLEDSQMSARITQVADSFPRPELYKQLPKEEKLQTIRQYSKAVELTLRVLNGEPILDAEVDAIKDIA